MNKQLECLMNLQRIDSILFAMNRTIKEFPKRIAEAELPLKDLQKTLDEAKQKAEAFEKKKRDKERALADIDEKIKKLKVRTSEIKTNKEYQALLKEIESIEKERSSIEDEILLVMEEMDAASKMIKSEEARFRVDGEKIETLKKKIGAEKSEVEKELAVAQEERTKIAGTVDKEAHHEYLVLIEACSGVAVVEAIDEICQGCNMNIPPQLFVELKKSDEILHCPQCRRILYYKNSQ